MRKIINVLIGIMLACTLVGCSNSEKNENSIEYVENAEFTSGEIKGLYTGDVLNGVPEGKGTLVTTDVEDGNWTYVGEWKEGFPNGQGRKEWEDGFAYEGEFVDGGVSGVTNSYKNGELIYISEIEEGKLARLVREEVELSADESMQYVHVGEIGFEIPQAWTYEMIDEMTVYINIPEQENVKVIFTAREELDLNEDTIREEIKNSYISKFENDYEKYSVINDVFDVDVVEQYDLHISFFSNDLLNPITDVYSKSFMRGWTPMTYTITTIQESGFYDYSGTVLCIENTLRNWDAIQEDIEENIKSEGLEYVKQLLMGDVNWEELEKVVPKLTGQDVADYTYKGQAVIVEGVINNISDESFDVWVSYDDTYMKLDDWRYDISNEDIVNGSTVQMCIETYVDGSLNSMDGIFAIRKMDVPIVEDIVKEFKDSCKEIDYKGILRNPDKAFGSIWKATGTVLQIIDTVDYKQELLLTLDNGDIVYVVYHKDENSDNVLEGDRISAYGTFYMTETYLTVLGDSKTVPCLNVDYVDIK